MNYPYVAKISCHHDCWSNPSEQIPDVHLEAFGIGCDENSAFAMVKMDGSEEDKKLLYERIKNHHCTIECRKKSQNYFFVRVKREDSFFARLLDFNCVVQNQVPIIEGTEIEKIFGFSKKSLMEALGRIKEERDIKVLSVRPVEKETVLSQKEQELLGLAIRNGYYEIPRKMHGEELAEQLGLKKSVVFERLRRIEKKIIEKYYGQS